MLTPTLLIIRQADVRIVQRLHLCLHSHIHHHWMVLELVRNLMAHAQKPHFVFPRNGRVHLNRWGSQFSRLLEAEMCASTLVMPDTPPSEVVWEYWLPTPSYSSPFTSPPVRRRVTPHSECSKPYLLYSRFKTNVLCHSILPSITYAAETPLNNWILYTLTCNIQHSALDIRPHWIGCYALIIRFIWLPSCRDAENAIYKNCLKSWTQTQL